jgi:peptidoglycan/xylan/chitin deacetylase (PgdA/CDA1 family)
MRARHASHRLLAGAAALVLSLAGLAAAGTPPAEAQTCPAPPPSFVYSAPATAPRTVALTLDDGPGPFLPQILTILRQYDVRATFFDIGARDALFPAMTRKIVADGHLLGDHSWDHLYPSQVPGGWTVPYLVDQISRTASQQEALTGARPCWFRPPGGYTDNVLTATRQLGMSAALWSIDPRDWEQPDYYSQASVDAIVRASTSTGSLTHPILLLHAGPLFRANTVAALPRIIAWYRANGYRFVDLDGGSGLLGRNTDFTGDQRGDVLATRPDGTLYSYVGNGAGGWLGQPQVGDGWGIADAMFFAGDFGSTGHPALLYRKSADGSLWMYTTDGTGGWSTNQQVGSGWDICATAFSPGDFDSDGHSDVMCLRRDDATLWLYPGAGNGGWGAPRRVGAGFSGWRQLLGAGDFDGNGYPDALGVSPAGALWLFSGNGFGGWASQRQVGDGWLPFPRVFSAGDFTGDGYPDVLAARADGTLWVYAGNGAGGWAGQFRAGAGWDALTLVTGVG